MSLRFDNGQKFVSDRQEGYCEHKVNDNLRNHITHRFLLFLIAV